MTENVYNKCDDHGQKDSQVGVMETMVRFML